MNTRLLLIPLIVWSAAACAENRQYPPVIDNSSYQAGVAPQPVSRAPSNDAIIELMGRVEQLRNEVQTLRGQVEEQGHSIDELKRRQDNIYTDVDGRLQKLETGGAAAAGGVPPAVEPQPSEPLSEGNVPQAAGPAEGQAESPSQAAENIPEASGVTAEQQPAAEPAESVESNAGAETAASLPSDDDALYRDANDAVKNGKYDQALLLLNKLVSDFPTSKYAEDAYFRLGVLNYTIKRDAAASRAAFQYLIDNYPKGQKVSDAMLKLGFLEYDQHNSDKARELFKAVIAKYPGSSAATLANNKLQQMNGIRR
jgi:tol-pal system protein YbgF